jgi:hypothetical protein
MPHDTKLEGSELEIVCECNHPVSQFIDIEPVAFMAANSNSEFYPSMSTSKRNVSYIQRVECICDKKTKETLEISG